MEELVGNLQTFESNHSQAKKGKDIALVSSNSVDDTENSDSSNDLDDAKFEAYFYRKFKKMWNKKKAFPKKDSTNPKAVSKGKFVPKIKRNKPKGASKRIQCYEC